MDHPHSDADKSQVARKTFVPRGLFPRQIVSAYSAEQWEEFIQEWSQSLRDRYQQVQRFSGPGDKGRDVVGFVNDPSSNGPWDNFQCKHYARPLHPSNIWVELGKLCYFSFNGDYTVPRSYRFVAPHDVGPTLKDLLLKPLELRQALIDKWAEFCEAEITDKQRVALQGELRAYVERFDFGIVGYCPLAEIIEGHMKTPFWATRFQAEVPPRPFAPDPPAELAPHETRYVRKLLDAYGDALKILIENVTAIETTPKYHRHLKRSRQWFFQAEALNRFSRDHYPPGAFEELKQQVFDGIVDTCEKDYTHGFERVCAATDRASEIVLGNSSLAPLAGVGDKKGLCHHLANEDQLDWVRK